MTTHEWHRTPMEFRNGIKPEVPYLMLVENQTTTIMPVLITEARKIKVRGVA